MYSFVWRHLPGPWPARLVTFLAGAFGIVVLLFLVVFPAVAPHLPWSHDTVNSTVQQPSNGDYDTGSSPATAPAASGAAASPTVLPGD